VLAGVASDDLIQLGPGRLSAAQLAFRVFLSQPPNDRLPADAPHIDVHESNVASGAGSKSRVLTTLFATLMGDNPGDLLPTTFNNAFDTLLKGGEDHIGREDDFIPRPERRSRSKWGRAGIGEARRCGNAPFSDPRGEVRGGAVRARGKIRVYLFFLSASSLLDQAVDDLDGPGADFDRLAAYYVGLGQSRTRPWVADDNPARRGRRAGVKDVVVKGGGLGDDEDYELV